jgi:hypothetical protein
MRPGACAILAAFVLAVLLAGLAPAQDKAAKKTGSVQGKVSYKGVPLPGGTVTFHPPKGKAISGWLDKEGSYSVKGVPAGPVKVTIETKSLKKLKGGVPKGKAPPPGTKYVPIPEKYASPETSGLILQVMEGKHTFDIELQ